MLRRFAYSFAVEGVKVSWCAFFWTFFSGTTKQPHAHSGPV
jgi:hypothetical protein